MMLFRWEKDDVILVGEEKYDDVIPVGDGLWYNSNVRRIIM